MPTIASIIDNVVGETMLNMMAMALLPPNPTIHIRALQINDLPELLQDCWRDRSPDAASATFNHLVSPAAKRDMGFVIINPIAMQPQIIGFGRLTVWVRYAEISDLIVVTELRSQGYGTTLIQYLMQFAHTLKLEYVEIGAAQSNPRALALYLRLGFQKSLTRYLDLGKGTEAVQYMRLRLSDADG